VQAFERAKTLCMDLADDELLLDVLPGLQGYYHVHGPLRSALELGEQLVTLARGRPEEPHRLLDARRRMGWSLFWAGEIAQAGNYLESALALYDFKDHQLYRKLYGDHPGVFSHCNLAWVRWSQGRTGEADRHANAALKLTEKMGHVLSLAYSTCMIGALYAVQQEYVAAKRLASQVIPLAEDKGFPYWMAWGHIIHGSALSHLGEPEQGILELSQGIDAYVATGAELFRPFALGLLAEALLLLNRHECVVANINEALQRTRDKNIHFYEPELLRLRGCALSASGAGPEQVETHFLEAAEIAARQGAYFFELRAVTALSRAYRDTGRQGKVLRLLAEVRSRSPDARITPDLQAADTLLAQLRHRSACCTDTQD
jgi:tetratricopeptide (TPR) repeat protein